jgi:hypothetical protein
LLLRKYLGWSLVEFKLSGTSGIVLLDFSERSDTAVFPIALAFSTGEEMQSPLIIRKMFREIAVQLNEERDMFTAAFALGKGSWRGG